MTCHQHRKYNDQSSERVFMRDYARIDRATKIGERIAEVLIVVALVALIMVVW